VTTSARARGRAAIAAPIGLAAIALTTLVALGRRAPPERPDARAAPVLPEGDEPSAFENASTRELAGSPAVTGGAGATPGAALESAPAGTTPTPHEFGDEPARGAKVPGSPDLASRASTSKAQAPPSLTDPLRIDAGKIPGPTLKPSGASSAQAPREVRAARSPAIALYHDAERSLIAGRGQECLSQLDRADATPSGPELREREQRAASPVVRAQCTMLLGRCDEGATRLRAAGWPDAAIESARARFCAK
jgi:hypothetical protein